jgi:hypothetical protein
VKRIVWLIVSGIAGLFATLGLTLGALALAGDDLDDVVQPQLSEQDRRTSTSPSPSVSSTPGVDASGSGGGSGDDSSGSGSDDSSGSGSDDSSGSGSGSDDGHSDDDD